MCQLIKVMIRNMIYLNVQINIIRNTLCVETIEIMNIEIIICTLILLLFSMRSIIMWYHNIYLTGDYIIY